MVAHKDVQSNPFLSHTFHMSWHRLQNNSKSFLSLRLAYMPETVLGFKSGRLQHQNSVPAC
eukprot:1873740-Amphidinium_carterae.1